MKKKILCIFFVLFLLSLSFNVTSIRLEKSITDDCNCENISMPLTDDDIKNIQNQIIDNDWSYTVDINPATDRSIDQLCGFDLPENWQENAKFTDPIKNPKLGTLSAVPESLDWRAELNGLPSVKSQDACGSCWAFATVGALECAIRRVDGKIVDLSEQYLVSCATEFNGCSGGFFAHDYHVNPGAVYESDFPYEAVDYRGCNAEKCGFEPVKCKDTNHVYKIEDWAYIGTSNSVPGVDEIKQAIYEYGPISVAVAVDSAFQGYTGGIFEGNAGNINHAVVLVGWNDDPGYWILRNSWGTGWGENGYMRIAYETSKVGQHSHHRHQMKMMIIR